MLVLITIFFLWGFMVSNPPVNVSWFCSELIAADVSAFIRSNIKLCSIPAMAVRMRLYSESIETSMCLFYLFICHLSCTLCFPYVFLWERGVFSASLLLLQEPSTAQIIHNIHLSYIQPKVRSVLFTSLGIYEEDQTVFPAFFQESCNCTFGQLNEMIHVYKRKCTLYSHK